MGGFGPLRETGKGATLYAAEPIVCGKAEYRRADQTEVTLRNPLRRDVQEREMGFWTQAPREVRTRPTREYREAPNDGSHQPSPARSPQTPGNLSQVTVP